MRQHGLKLSQNAIVKLRKLHFQYIEPVFNKKFWPGEGDCLAVRNSPHVRFLKTYEKVGSNWDILWKTDYINQMKYWYSIGYKKRNKKFMRRKIQRFISLYCSIKKNGFKQYHRINILKTPLWITRYGKTAPFLKGYEIWHGHHRAACCYVLGIHKVPCAIMRDNKRGTKKCARIDRHLKGIYEQRKDYKYCKKL